MRNLRLRLRRRHRCEAEAEPAAAAAPDAASAPHIAGTPAPGSPAGRPPAGALSRLSSGPPLLPPDSLPPRLHAPLAAVRWGFRGPPNHEVDLQASARASPSCAALGTGPGALRSAGAALMT